MDIKQRVSWRDDDTWLTRLVLATHIPDSRSLDAKPLLPVIEVLLKSSSDILSRQPPDVSSEDKVLYSETLDEIIDFSSMVVTVINCKINCSADKDTHSTAMDILELTHCYSWEAKVVLSLLAFARALGALRLIIQNHSTHPLANAMFVLKQLPKVLKNSTALRPRLDVLQSLVDKIFSLTKKIVKFYDITTEYFSSESPEIMEAASMMPVATYWTVRGIVVSGFQIITLDGMSSAVVPSEQWELPSLTQKLDTIEDKFGRVLKGTQQFIEKKKEEELLLKPLRSSLESSDIDNMRSLKALFKHDQPTLYDCYNKKRVPIEDLRAKTVLLFVTDLDPELTVSDEYVILRQMCSEKRQNPRDLEIQYEVVWVPVRGMWTEKEYRQFDAQREQMADVHAVHHPSVVSALVIRYIKQNWGFNTKPLVVVMDTGGKIVHKDSIHMMRIWGSKAYPFTADREKSLWEKMSWTVELLAANLDPDMDIWVQEKRYICLYGGEDVEWIRKFTRTARAVACESRISLEMLYTGKYHPKETVTKRSIAIITVEKLSKTLDWDRIRYFWHRLDRLWGYSKGTLAAPPGNEAKAKQIAKGVKDMVRYGRSRHGWAIIGGPEGVMAKGNGALMLAGLMGHMDWRAREAETGFVPALREQLRKIQPDEPGRFMTRLVVPSPEPMRDNVDCSECNQTIQMFTVLPDTLSD